MLLIINSQLPGLIGEAGWSWRPIWRPGNNGPICDARSDNIIGELESQRPTENTRIPAVSGSPWRQISCAGRAVLWPPLWPSLLVVLVCF